MQTPIELKAHRNNYDFIYLILTFLLPNFYIGLDMFWLITYISKNCHVRKSSQINRDHSQTNQNICIYFSRSRNYGKLKTTWCTFPGPDFFPLTNNS